MMARKALRTLTVMTIVNGGVSCFWMAQALPAFHRRV
jgi:hypothetical protein